MDVNAIVEKLAKAQGHGGEEDGDASMPLYMAAEDFLSCIRYGPDGDPKPSVVAEKLEHFIRLTLRKIESEGD